MNSKIVAAVQFSPVLMNVEKNLAVALQLTFEAAAKGARLIVLPELCLSGYVLNNLAEAMQCAQDKDGYQTEAFLPIARRFGCHIIFGYVELLNGKLFNSAAVIGPMGLKCSVQKHNLHGSDNLWAQPSEQIPPIIITEAGRTGVLICRDAMNRYRESYVFYKAGQKFYRQGSVDTIALLTNWGDHYSYPDTGWVELVEETRANLVVSNRVGSERDMHYKGGSCIINPDRKIWTNGSSFTDDAVVGGLIQL